MAHAPETGTENPYQITCTGFLQIDFFSGTKSWYRVGQCSTQCRKPWPKWRVLIGKTIASCVFCLQKLCCLLFYCFKVNWEYSSIEKLIQKFCFQFHLVRKTLSENGTSFLVQVFGTGFWCVCHWHYRWTRACSFFLCVFLTRASLFVIGLVIWCITWFLFLCVSTSTIDCRERLVPKMGMTMLNLGTCESKIFVRIEWRIESAATIRIRIESGCSSLCVQWWTQMCGICWFLKQYCTIAPTVLASVYALAT